MFEANQCIMVSVKLNHISITYLVLISIMINQSSNLGHIPAKFAQNQTILNLKNLAKCLAKWRSPIWLNLAKFRPSFGYFENFDLATLVALDYVRKNFECLTPPNLICISHYLPFVLKIGQFFSPFPLQCKRY